MKGPRFEQMDMALQPQPLSAMEMIQREPIRLVAARVVGCDGGECASVGRRGSRVAASACVLVAVHLPGVVTLQKKAASEAGTLSREERLPASRHCCRVAAPSLASLALG
jgi:hypothetical protein